MAPSEAAHSSDIWVARMKSTGAVRQHADSAAGDCLSNTFCYSENIVIHLHAFGPQARTRVLSRAVRCFRGLWALKYTIYTSAEAAQLTAASKSSLFDPTPPRHHQEWTPLVSTKADSFQYIWEGFRFELPIFSKNSSVSPILTEQFSDIWGCSHPRGPIKTCLNHKQEQRLSATWRAASVYNDTVHCC